MVKRFYIDKPGGSYGTKPKKRGKIFKRKPRILQTTTRTMKNGDRYTEHVVECRLPGSPTMTIGLNNPEFRKSGVIRNKRLLK